PTSTSLSLSLPCSIYPLPPHSFPTRRSSDLHPDVRPAERPRLRRVPDEAGDGVAPRPQRLHQVRTDEPGATWCRRCGRGATPSPDRKSTRLNSSHVAISYAVFCLKKKNIQAD